MSELTSDQAHSLRAELEALAVELRGAIDATAQDVKPVDLEQPIGRLSRMDALQQQSMARATREAAQMRLRQVEAALLRFDDGEYGACLECEEPIGHARLQARPEAVLCIACQSSREGRR